LVASVDTNPRAAAITAALIDLCMALKLEMTIEGVERAGQFRALANHRFISLQGYLISRPLAVDMVLPTRKIIPQLMQDLLLSGPAASPRSPGRRARVRTIAT
jgi:EAL domain-containing protein (putative c-di-GMP-specific phosphodiesterase class I)